MADSGPALRGRVARASGRVAPRGPPPDHPPVSRLYNLPLADPGRAAVLPPRFSQTLCAPGGTRALGWYGPEPSASRDARPLPPPPRSAACPRRCPRPRPPRPGAATVVVLPEAAPGGVPAAPLGPMTGPSGAWAAPKTL